jgi:hypothetical protein
MESLFALPLNYRQEDFQRVKEVSGKSFKKYYFFWKNLMKGLK